MLYDYISIEINQAKFYSLECRSLRGGLRELCKIPRALDLVNIENILPVTGESLTRGHGVEENV